MAEVQAWQHIYTSVEREQSPHDREGFQTLFYSRAGLTEAEVREMEARLVYFPSHGEPVKRLFCAISTGKLMVAQVVHLPDPDRMGRKGRYLAHNLVFEAGSFERIESDPFLVFRQYPFITTVAEALRQGDLRTGDISPVSFTVTLEPTRGVRAARAWPVRDLSGLALLALRADRLAGDRSAIAFVGEPAEVETGLEAAFFAVPTPVRSRCSFDTYFHGCNLVDTYTWALGLLESPANRRLIEVSTQSRHLAGAAAYHPETAYERWVTTLIGEQRLESIGRYRDHAFAICEWLEGRARAGALIDAAPPEVLDSVLQLNREPLQALLFQKLERLLPGVLARRAFHYLDSELPPVEMLGRLRAGLQLPELVEILYRSYEVQGFRAPPHEEIQAVDWLLQRVDHPFLRLFHICWAGRRDALAVELQLLGEGEYRQFVQVALGTGLVEPWMLLVPRRGDQFLDLVLPAGVPAGHGLVDLVRALLGVGEAACLSRLAPYIRGQARQDLRALQGIVARQPGLPEPFRRAVSDAVAALPSGGIGLLARLMDWTSRFK